MMLPIAKRSRIKPKPLTDNQHEQQHNAALGCSVRTVIINEEPWFVAKDVCDALEIGNSRQAVSYLDDDEKGVTTNDTLGGTQQVSIINESGLYSLILRSRKPEAKKFKKWVTEEVLPTIHKHGIYATGEKLLELISKPENAIKVFQTLKDEQDKRKGRTLTGAWIETLWPP